MADFSFLTSEDIFKKAQVILKNNKVIAGIGDEGIPDSISDCDWVRQSLHAGSIANSSRKKDLLRFWTSADTKFEDTSLGGNYVVNPRPQFTRYADTRALGISGDTDKVSVGKYSNRLGMGLYYSDAIDDTHQTIHMIFGQAEFNSLGNYFSNFFNLDASRLANGGRWSEIITTFFKRGTTLFLGIVFWPITLTLYGLSKTEEILRYMLRKPASKYYYMRANMQLYWSTVSTMVNRIASTSGMTRFSQNDNLLKKISEGGEPQMNEDYKQMLASNFKDMFNDDGYINIQRVVNRAQRLRNEVEKQLNEKIESGLPAFSSFVSAAMRDRQDKSDGLGGQSLSELASQHRTDEQKLWQDRFDSAIGNWKEGDGDASLTKLSPLEMSVQSTLEDDGKGNKVVKPNGKLSQILSTFESEWRDGSAFATFRVDHTGSVDESFSSSVGETDLATTFNSTSAQARAGKFSLAGGNLVGGVLGGTVGAILSAARGVVEGTASWLGIDGILAPGNGFADIPQFWQNSAASLPRMNYSIDLVSPYGDPLSRMMNIYIPLAMLLTAALPLSTGKQSYTSPFLCQVFDQGRAITRLGIVDSLQITRGTSNLAFNKNKQFMSVNVAFSVRDLSSVMHMPIATGFSFDPLKGLFDEDTSFSDYIGVLSSLSLGKSHYLSEKIAIKALNKWRGIQNATNTDQWIAYLHDRTFLGWGDVIFKNSERI